MTEPQGFIRDFKHLILDDIRCTPEWAEMVSISTLSSCMGNSVRTLGRIGPTNLNVFMVTIGPSGQARKSAPLKYFQKKVLMKAGRMAAEKSGVSIDTWDDWKEFDVTLPYDFSIEGIIEYFSKWRSEGVIIFNEFAQVLKVQNKRYKSGLLDFISDMYDGRLEKRYTRTYKTDYVDNCTVNMIGATTPHFYQVMDSQFFVQGLGNRIIWNLYPEKIPEPERIDPFGRMGEYQNERENFLNHTADTLSEWLRFQERDDWKLWVNPSDIVRDMFADYNYELKQEVAKIYSEDDTDLEASYLDRLTLNTMKICALHTISRNLMTPSKYDNHTTNTMTMTAEDAEWAIDRGYQYLEDFRRMNQERYARQGEPEPVHTISNHMNKALAVLKLNGGELSLTPFKAKMGFQHKHELFDTVIDALIDKGKIIRADGESTSQGGRKPTVFKLVDYSSEMKAVEEDRDTEDVEDVETQSETQ